MGIRVAHDVSGMPASAAGTIFAEKLPVAADASLIRPIVSRHLGVLRNAGAIQGAIAALLPLAEGNGPAADPATVALLIAVFASLRMESRGAHARTDFPLKLAQANRRRMRLAQALEIARATPPYAVAPLYTLARSA